MKYFIKYIRFVFSYSVAELFPLQMRNPSQADTLRGRLFHLVCAVARSVRRWISSFLNISSLAVVVLTMLVLWGLANGTAQVINKSFRENPRILGINAYAGTGDSGLQAIDKELLDRIRTFRLQDDGTVSAAKSGDSVIERVSPWSDVAMRFYSAEGELMPDYTDGRTVAVDDKVLEMAVYENGRKAPAMQPGMPGLIVSRRLLEDLEFQGESPQVIFMKYQNRRSPVKVLEIAEDLPGGDFFMTNGFYHDIIAERWIPVPHYTDFFLGPVDADSAAAIAEEAAPRVADKLSVKAVERTGSAKWLHFSIKNGGNWSGQYIEETWLPGFLRAIGGAATAALQTTGVEFTMAVEEREAGKVSAVSDKMTFSTITVYVSHIDYLLPTMHALRQVDLHCDNEVAERLRWADKIKNFSTGVSLTVIIVVALLAMANIYLSFMQKINATIPEIGVLKSFGASGLTIMIIQVVEAAIIWGMAFPVGLLLAKTAGTRVQEFLLQTFDLDPGMHLFALTEVVVYGTAAGSLFVSVLASSLATVFAVRLQPAEALLYRA